MTYYTIPSVILKQVKKLISLVFIIVSVNQFAQEEKDIIKQNSFQPEFGINQIKEENLHPKVHGGVSYGLIYERIKQSENTSLFSIGFLLSRLKTTYEDLSASANIQLYGNYCYLFEAVDKNKLTYSIGPEVRLHYNLSFYPNWDESHLYRADYLALGAGNKLIYQINANRSATVSLTIPLISFFSRPELDRQYKIDDTSVTGILENMHSNPKGGTINKSFMAFTQFEYRFNITDRIMQAICYFYRYQRLKSKDGFAFQNNRHNIGFEFYF